MDWKDRTVSMGLVDSEAFDGKLANVTVSERRVVVEPHDVEDWERIFRELGEGIVLEEVRWEEVTEITKTIDDLYYPHINIRFERDEDGDEPIEPERERRIFFTQDEIPVLEKCFKSINKFWNQWKQYNVTDDNRFPDDIDSDVEEDVELDEALAANAADADPTDDGADDAPANDAANTTDTADDTDGEEESDSAEDEVAQESMATGEEEDYDENEESDADSDEDIDTVVDRLMEE